MPISFGNLSKVPVIDIVETFDRHSQKKEKKKMMCMNSWKISLDLRECAVYWLSQSYAIVCFQCVYIWQMTVCGLHAFAFYFLDLWIQINYSQRNPRSITSIDAIFIFDWFESFMILVVYLFKSESMPTSCQTSLLTFTLTSFLLSFHISLLFFLFFCGSFDFDVYLVNIDE